MIHRLKKAYLRGRLLLAFWLALSASLPVSPTGLPSLAAPEAPNDNPVTLVNLPVTSYSLRNLKIYWHSAADICPPTSPQPGEQPELANAEVIRRIGLNGYPDRSLFYHAGCNINQVFSNIVADDDFVYFLGGSHLMRLPTSASPGDSPQALSQSIPGPGEIAQSPTTLYALNGSGSNTFLQSIDKASGFSSGINAPGQSGYSLSYDGEYIYFIKANGGLRRIKQGVGLQDIVPGVSAYYAEGLHLVCGQIICFQTHNVYAATGSQIFVYNNLTNTLAGSPSYTAEWNSLLNEYNQITQVFADDNNLYVFERKRTGCDPLCVNTDILYRAPHGGGAKTPLYINSGILASHLTADATFLYWQDSALRKIAKDAAGLSLVNIKVTGIEVTQGIQDLNNSEALIAGRRTFVRVYVKSDGPGDVKGVMAQLSATWSGGGGGPLIPVSRVVTQKISGVLKTYWVGPSITVRQAPDRNNPDDSFVFELPWDWLSHGPMVLTAILNPYQLPLEPNYGDNSAQQPLFFTIPFSALPSPTLNLTLVSFGYTINGKNYYPRYDKDILQTISWLQRAYPLAYGPPWAGNTSPGLHVRWLQLLDDQLGGKVWTPSDCKENNSRSTCNNMRASEYANNFFKAYRSVYGIPNNEPVYSMITDAAGYFARGQESGGRVSSGPTGDPGGMSWDTDGSYGDWYAGHEIGHALGRGHPKAASGTNANGKTDATHCGHSGDDGSYPYPDALIGPSGSSLAGYDPGIPGVGIQPAVYPASTWHDVMSYCPSEWLSPYTYWGIYSFLINNPTSLQSAKAASPTPPGDYLVVSGSILTTTQVANFSFVRRMSNTEVPALVTGGYSIRLLDGAAGQLADYPFTPQAVEEGGSGYLGFYQAVNFVPGVRQVQIVRTGDNKVFGSMPVSANSPAVSNVTLAASSPVTGTATLSWSTSDPDGGTLAFDILYSRDGGATFQPVRLGVNKTQAAIDTNQLGGGTGFFRVTASDGLLTGQADSPSYSFANKPPQPQIYTPTDGLHIRYGQLVNLSGDGRDLQDGGVADAGLAWSTQKGPLGVGPLLSLTDLPIGVNIVTLTASNSMGLSASASITITVDDDLTSPGPVLSAAPLSFAWQVGAPSDPSVSGSLSLSNSGGGNLSWTAQSNAAWLSVDKLSGSAPDVLALTANHSGLQDNTIYSATLTLVGTAINLEQTITIPVRLLIGNVPNPGGSPQGAVLYLPMLQR